MGLGGRDANKKTDITKCTTSYQWMVVGPWLRRGFFYTLMGQSIYILIRYNYIVYPFICGHVHNLGLSTSMLMFPLTNLGP